MFANLSLNLMKTDCDNGYLLPFKFREKVEIIIKLCSEWFSENNNFLLLLYLK